MTARNLDSPAIMEAWAMLQFIPSDDRDQWVKVGGILKDEYGDTAFSMWDEWSRQSDRYQERAARDVWRSLGKNRNRAGIGTLVYLARSYGWRPDSTTPAPLPQPRTPPAARQRDTASYARELWLVSDWSDSAVASHPYAVKKGITHAGGAKRGKASGRVIGRNTDCIIVPVRDIPTSKVVGVQCINADGAKQTFGPTKGNALILGNSLDLNSRWYVAEGWASAYSVVFHHGGTLCAAAFGKSNLMAVAERIAEVYTPDEIVIIKEAD